MGVVGSGRWRECVVVAVARCTGHTARARRGVVRKQSDRGDRGGCLDSVDGDKSCANRSQSICGLPPTWEGNCGWDDVGVVLLLQVLAGGGGFSFALRSVVAQNSQIKIKFPKGLARSRVSK